MKTPLDEGDYVLVEGAGWFDVKGFTVWIHAADEGVVVDIFKNPLAEPFDEPLASTCALDSDCEEEPEELK